MIDIELIRKNPNEIKQKLRDRIDPKVIDQLILHDEKWRKEKTALDALLQAKNEISKQAQKDPSARDRAKVIKTKIAKQQEVVAESAISLEAIQLRVPNIPHQDTPSGKTSNENVTAKEVGNIPEFQFTPKSYLELNESSSSVEIPQATKASGARFAYVKGIAAQIEFALLSYAVQKLSKLGFELVFPPTLIKRNTMRGMGYLDQAGEKEIFSIPQDDLFLVGTAEQSLGALHMDSIFSHNELPKRYMAFTPCYRREAGSYGKDTKGILRVHQFEKLEMFSFTTQHASDEEHTRMLEIQESLMKELALPYRVVKLCAGDLGLPSARTFDIETFLPGQLNGKGEYRETHSTSTCTDFQSRRLHIQYQTEAGKKEYVHTVNGTVFAMQRMIIAIMENYQTKTGDIRFPQALEPYRPVYTKP